MPKIPDEVVKRVIDRARIEDVVGDFVKLRKAGVNLTGLCPFHDDKTDGNFIASFDDQREARRQHVPLLRVYAARRGRRSG